MGSRPSAWAGLGISPGSDKPALEVTNQSPKAWCSLRDWQQRSPQAATTLRSGGFKMKAALVQCQNFPVFPKGFIYEAVLATD